MLARRSVLAIAATAMWFLLLGQGAHAALPPGYVPIPGIIPLNPAHVGAVGSQYRQFCEGLPRPLQPGEVAWHFILPQTIFRGNPTPENVFDVLRVTFQSAGLITLTSFGPPSAAHAYVFTSADDTLLAGDANIGELPGTPLGLREPQFNLSHTCASPLTPTTVAPTTAPITAPPITEPPSTVAPTTDPGTPTTDPGTPTTDPGTPTTDPGTPTTTPGGSVSPTSAANVTGDPSTLPTTGTSDVTLMTALVVLAVGGFLLLVGRRFRRLDD
jgi:LPXTG-motif cell wall-anchored protein